ncbi:MAG: hydrolase [Eggerthellaceae bacterium]|nr:hydrolase [Eggerthellaceae bacterium]
MKQACKTGSGVLAFARMALIIGAVLCAVLSLSLFAITAFAEDEEPTPEEFYNDATDEDVNDIEEPEITETDENALNNIVNPQQLPDSSFIYDALISDLASADSYLNEQTVQVVGEVVGDRIRSEQDDGYCWITLQSLESPYDQIAVYMSTSDAEVIDTYGAYDKKGTTLQVRGTFYLVDSENEGLSDLHANNVYVVERGYVVKEEFNIYSFIPGAILVAIGFVLIFVYRRLQEGMR